jgi:aminopeptidase N
MQWWEEIFLNEGFANFFEFDTPTVAFPNQRKYLASVVTHARCYT